MSPGKPKQDPKAVLHLALVVIIDTILLSLLNTDFLPITYIHNNNILTHRVSVLAAPAASTIARNISTLISNKKKLSML